MLDGIEYVYVEDCCGCPRGLSRWRPRHRSTSKRPQIAEVMADPELSEAFVT